MNKRICVEIDNVFYKSLYQAHLILCLAKKTIKKRAESNEYNNYKIVNFRVDYTHKTCSKCGEEKELIKFRKITGKNLDGRSSWCNKCHSLDNMIRDKKDRSKPNKRARRFSQTEQGRISSRINKANRRAREKEAKVPLSIEERQEIKTIYTTARKLRNRGQDVVVDHKIPITRGGKHHPDNLRIVGQYFNLVKSNRLDSEL